MMKGERIRIVREAMEDLDYNRKVAKQALERGELDVVLRYAEYARESAHRVAVQLLADRTGRVKGERGGS